MVFVVGILGAIALFVVAICWRGFVLSVVWNWFAPVIFGLPMLGVAQAIAVSLLVGMFSGHRHDERERSERWLEVFLAPLIALSVAWIVRGFL